MCTLLSHSEHRCHSAVSAAAVTALSAVTAVTLVCTVVLQRCNVIVTVVLLLSVYIADTLVLLPWLSQSVLPQGHCCHNAIKYTAVTELSLPLMSHQWHITAVTLVWTAV